MKGNKSFHIKKRNYHQIRRKRAEVKINLRKFIKIIYLQKLLKNQDKITKKIILVEELNMVKDLNGEVK